MIDNATGEINLGATASVSSTAGLSIAASKTATFNGQVIGKLNGMFGGATTAAFTALQSGWDGTAKGGIELNSGSSSSFANLAFVGAQSKVTAPSAGSVAEFINCK